MEFLIQQELHVSAPTMKPSDGSKLFSAVSWLLPKWFLEEFGGSLLEDLVDVAKEHGATTWWLVLSIELIGIVSKFALKRFHRRRTQEKSSPASDE